MASHSAEVAADFRDALQDLKINSRPEISSLTVIAKESTEHAQAISRELENHIRATRPEWKLPALYVLDSIVKNVGTPYTVYLGRNLFRTFMEAYTLVDAGTRKALEGLLKTWKLPVPESLDTRPVFPPEVTREIENALIKFRTVTIQHQQQQARNQRPPYGQLPARVPQQPQWRESPTPNPQGVPYGYPPQHPNQPPPRSPTQRYQSPAMPSLPPGHQYSGPPNAPTPDLGRIKDNLKGVILSATMQVSQRPTDERARLLLTTLLDLQKVLDASGVLGADQIRQVESEIQRISGALSGQAATPILSTTPFAPPSASSTPVPQGPNPMQFSLPFPPQSAPISQRATPQPPQPTAADLSQLLRQFNNTPAPAPVESRPTPPPAHSTQDLLASLRAAGLLPGSSATPEPAAQRPLQTAPIHDVRLDPVSLKISRPNLITLLYSAKPDQCRECGRRFPATDDGKKRKTKHLDWHFKVNMRIADSSKNVISRSWYIDEREWIEYRESDDTASDNKGNGPSKAKKPDPKDQYVPVPADASLANAHCPICQEKFEAQWHEETQQPVWFDAMYSGGRVFHASCYAELARASGVGGGVTGRTGGGNIAASNTARCTPDPVLGKRKWQAGAE